MCCRHTLSSRRICLCSALHSPLCQWSRCWIKRLKSSKRYEPPPLFSMQVPFVCYNSSLPPAPPAILPHPVPVPHYFPHFFPQSSAPCSNVSIPLTPVSPWFHGSIFHLLLLSSSPWLYTIHFFLPVFFFSPSLTGQRRTAPTNVTWLSPQVPRTGTVLGIHKKCLPQKLSLALANPAMNTLLRGSRISWWILTRKAQPSHDSLV